MSSADRVVNGVGGGILGYALWTIVVNLGGRLLAVAVFAGAVIVAIGVVMWREDVKREREGFYDRHE